MQTIKNLLIYPIMLLTLSSMFGQETQINFTIESQQLTIDEDVIAMFSQIEKDGNSLIWTQESSGQQMSTSYNISSTSGDWDSANNTGEQEYVLELNGFESLFKITSNSEGTIAQMFFYESGGVIEQFTFNVSTITFN